MKTIILVVISCIFVVALTGRHSFAQMDSGMEGEMKGEMKQQGTAPLLDQSLEGDKHKKGRKLYKNKCQFCHGIRGDGKGPAAEPLMGHPVDFTDSKFWEDDVENKIEDTIKNGKEMMPAFDLEPGEIKAVIWYMSHTFKKATQNNN